jgi:peptide/nickel transport system permease protein
VSAGGAPNEGAPDEGGSKGVSAPPPRGLMVHTVGRRLLRSLLMLWLITVFAFGLLWLVPGDPASTLAGEFPSEEEVEEIRQKLELDEPWIVQYGHWIGGAVQGDLGESLRSGRSVTDEIMARLPVTLSLTLFAVAFGLIIAVPLGTIAALKRGSILDRLLTMGSTLGVATPNFFLAILLVILVALNSDIFPATGYAKPSESIAEWAKHCTLPGLALGAALGAELARQIRSALIELLHSDYIRTARAKGVPAWKVLTKHAYKNAAIPVVTILGAQIAVLFGGTIIIEQIFAMPGIGGLAISAVRSQDIPMIQGVVVVAGGLILLLNTVVDLSYGFLDPRTRR